MRPYFSKAKKQFSEKHQKFQLVLTSKHSKRAGKVQNNIDQSKVYKIFSEKRYKMNSYVNIIWGVYFGVKLMVSAITL